LVVLQILWVARKFVSYVKTFKDKEFDLDIITCGHGWGGIVQERI
jgi:hypothetical protein